MRIQPSSTINLYSGVDIDMGEQLAFSSRANQLAYFGSKLVRAQTPCTMVRKTGMLRIELDNQLKSQIKSCNYISFVNPDFDNKEVYGRILDYDYVNNETVDIAYGIDYWQTWMFDVTFKDSYIEREHLSETLFNLAETNPYDLRIMEFRTSENLPISKELEKPDYDILWQTLPYADGIMLGDAYMTDNQISITDSLKLGCLIRLSNIDFSDLDETYKKEDPSYPTPGHYIYPSHLFLEFIKKCVDQTRPMGYVKLTQPMYDYLNDKYTTEVPNTPIIRGTDWSEFGSGRDITEFNHYDNNCCVIYEPNGASSDTIVPELLTLLTLWECISSIVDMVVVPKDLMGFASISNVTGENIQMYLTTASIRSGITNKKLALFPFSYLRLIAPNGDTKELHYEDFFTQQNGTDRCEVRVGMDLSDKPTLCVVPEGYRMSGVGQPWSRIEDTNVFEGIEFDQFPTMPYNIDAYLAQVAAVANEVIRTNTLDNLDSLSVQQQRLSKEATALDFGSKVAGMAAGLGADASINTDYSKEVGRNKNVTNYSQTASSTLPGVGQAVVAGLNAANMGYQYGTDLALGRDLSSREMAIRKQGAGQVLMGEIGPDNALALNMALTRGAYACDKYVRGNGIGNRHFNNFGFCDIIYMKAQLNPTIREKYDTYFTQYGYTSGRCGIPRVCAFVNGSTNNDEIPHWLPVDGKPCTYIKTSDCRVTHSMLPVEAQIKAMFDGGVRMINGDPSTP